MNAAKTVTARFDTVARYTLTVSKTPVAPILGAVTSDPVGINCGLLCVSASASFPAGTVVTLSGQNGLGRLVNWTGDCAGTGACVLTMDSDKVAVGHFAVLLAPASSETRPVAMPVIATTLRVPGGRGDVTADGRTTVIGADGVPARVEMKSANALVEGILREAAGGGLWTFDLDSRTAEAVTVTVLSGEPVTATPYAIVFRVRGRPGERVSFVLRRSQGNGDLSPSDP